MRINVKVFKETKNDFSTTLLNNEHFGEQELLLPWLVCGNGSRSECFGCIKSPKTKGAKNRAVIPIIVTTLWNNLPNLRVFPPNKKCPNLPYVTILTTNDL